MDNKVAREGRNGNDGGRSGPMCWLVGWLVGLVGWFGWLVGWFAELARHHGLGASRKMSLLSHSCLR